MWRDKRRKHSHLLRTIVWSQVGMALLIVSLGLSTRVVAFTLDTALLPGAEARHDTTSSAESEPPSPQFLRLGITITQGRVTIGPVISPTWKAAQQRDVQLPLADQARAPEKQPVQTAENETTRPRLSGVETLLLRTVHAPVPTEAHAPRTAKTAPVAPLKLASSPLTLSAQDIQRSQSTPGEEARRRLIHGVSTSELRGNSGRSG